MEDDGRVGVETTRNRLSLKPQETVYRMFTLKFPIRILQTSELHSLSLDLDLKPFSDNY